MTQTPTGPYPVKTGGETSEIQAPAATPALKKEWLEHYNKRREAANEEPKSINDVVNQITMAMDPHRDEAISVPASEAGDGSHKPPVEYVSPASTVVQTIKDTFTVEGPHLRGSLTDDRGDRHGSLERDTEGPQQ